ncbi:glycosyltransferase family 8 protein [Myriangium duriaei CBS 260.36]|uniref:Glycosyltransferase family 8 protein n=1 Tax=Myriangium duriaei CBS 260.36 TaxID=1168546 RepID=A0A9P4J7N6_9PEZI|nr:glycosyltransferase family 8 protein [Myriangium duriaei CBS 260.36]
MASGWTYAPVGEPASSRKPLFGRARACLASKVFWRTLLAVGIVLLIADLARPANDVLLQYGHGWTPSSAPGSRLHGPPSSNSSSGVDWTQFAYCQYVTTPDYLCNSVMAFESLVNLGAKAERLMMYPEEWTVDESTREGRLLVKARDVYGAHLAPIKVERYLGEMTWAESFTKLLAFNQTSYKRVLSLDSDATILKPMDELFLLPTAPVAMPRAYWLDKHGFLSSQVVLIEPSKQEFDRIREAFQSRKDDDFDMEIVNNLYGDNCMILPHRRYDLISGEFKGKSHTKYLGSDREVWNAKDALAEAKLVHFSDWPLPKPWKPTSRREIEKVQPTCTDLPDGKKDCLDREVWLGIYQDFRNRRERVCGAEFKAVVTS